MKLPTLKNRDGFTIIEVVLVLAIAGLIFLIVFLALPALQRNQRDTQRRNDVGRVITAVTNFTANNNGDIPSDAEFIATGSGSFLEEYLNAGDDEFADPSEGDYTLVIGTTPSLGNISYETGENCGGD